MTPTATLERLTPLLGIVAAERTAGRPDLFEDARQEGLIRAWQVAEAKPDAPREYVLAAAKRGIGDVVRGRPAFGAESHRGRQDAGDTASPLEPVVAGEEQDAGSSAALEDPSAALALEQVEGRFHAAEIARAVSTLEPVDAEAVRLRFAHGYSYPEAAARLGVPVGTLTRRWSTHVRPALRAALAHLEDAA